MVGSKKVLQGRRIFGYEVTLLLISLQENIIVQKKNTPLFYRIIIIYIIVEVLHLVVS